MLSRQDAVADADAAATIAADADDERQLARQVARCLEMSVLPRSSWVRAFRYRCRY